MKKYLLLAVVCLLAACSQGVNGVYADAMGVSRYTFESGGKLTIETMGIAQETTYERDGDQVKIALPQKGASITFTLEEDGSLQGPLGIRLEKTDK